MSDELLPDLRHDLPSLLKRFGMDDRCRWGGYADRAAFAAGTAARLEPKELADQATTASLPTGLSMKRARVSRLM